MRNVKFLLEWRVNSLVKLFGQIKLLWTVNEKRKDFTGTEEVINLVSQSPK